MKNLKRIAGFTITGLSGITLLGLFVLDVFYPEYAIRHAVFGGLVLLAVGIGMLK